MRCDDLWVPDLPPARFVGGAHLGIARDWWLGGVVGLPLARLTVTDDEVWLRPIAPRLFRIRVAQRDLVQRVTRARLRGIRIYARDLPLGGFVFSPWTGTTAEVLDQFRLRGWAVDDQSGGAAPR